MPVFESYLLRNLRQVTFLCITKSSLGSGSYADVCPLVAAGIHESCVTTCLPWLLLSPFASLVESSPPVLNGHTACPSQIPPFGFPPRGTSFLWVLPEAFFVSYISLEIVP